MERIKAALKPLEQGCQGCQQACVGSDCPESGGIAQKQPWLWTSFSLTFGFQVAQVPSNPTKTRGKNGECEEKHPTGHVGNHQPLCEIHSRALRNGNMAEEAKAQAIPHSYSLS